jgi:hypothetical protein
LEVNYELGYIAISDEIGKLLLVYSTPVALLLNNKTVVLPLGWDGGTFSITFEIPAGTAFPLIVAFGISTNLPKSNELHWAFSHLKIQSPESEEEEVSHDS